MIHYQTDKGHLLVLGDFNGDLEDSLVDNGKYPPDQRASKLLDFENYFNLCPANLLSNCDGPLETYISDCGRHRPTLDYSLGLIACLATSFHAKPLICR